MVKYSEMRELELSERAGLPEPLRVLLAQYPRVAWPDDPGFGDLIRFWLERHLMFRKLLDLLLADREALAAKDGAEKEALRRLNRFGGRFVGELHMHHTVEDTQYFPKLRALEPEIAHGFDLLDGDHHVLEAELQWFASTAQGLLAEHTPDNARRFGDGLAKMAPLLDRHLVDEEELIVPILLKYAGHF